MLTKNSLLVLTTLIAVAIISSPSSVNVSVNAIATFTCLAENVTLFAWYLNGSIASYLANVMIESNKESDPAESILKLSISGANYLSLNQSYVECRAVGKATDMNVYPYVTSSKALLLIQGMYIVNCTYNLYSTARLYTCMLICFDKCCDLYTQPPAAKPISLISIASFTCSLLIRLQYRHCMYREILF